MSSQPGTDEKSTRLASGPATLTLGLPVVRLWGVGKGVASTAIVSASVENVGKSTTASTGVAMLSVSDVVEMLGTEETAEVPRAVVGMSTVEMTASEAGAELLNQRNEFALVEIVVGDDMNALVEEFVTPSEGQDVAPVAVTFQ